MTHETLAGPKQNARASPPAPDERVVAYLPPASLADTWQEYIKKAFGGLARVKTIDTERVTPAGDGK